MVHSANPSAPPTTPYAELHTISNFTFLRGASHPEELVAQAHALGYQALALTDECSLAGVVRAHGAAKACGLKLIIGSELRLTCGLRLVLLVPDRAAYEDLVSLITTARRRSEKGTYQLTRADIAPRADRLFALWLPPPQAVAPRSPLGGTPPPPSADGISPAELAGQLAWLATTFPARSWLAMELHRNGADGELRHWLEQLAHQHQLPLVASGGALMHHPARQRLADLLTAIRLKRPLAEVGLALEANRERHLRPWAQLTALYPTDGLAETMRIAARCTFSLAELSYNFPLDFVPVGESPRTCLRRLTEAGFAHHWPQGNPRVRQLIEHELAVIAELGYEPYFLAVHDIVRFAREQAILCQGRGSAANSAVCYCLGITAVDPARMEMLFERFISKERGEPPDIDVDFEHERREEVIQYLYRRYGRERSALAASVITYRTKSAVRDTARALGLEPAQVDRIAGQLAWWDRDRDSLEARLREVGFDPHNPTLRLLLDLVPQLRGFPRHLSQHVGGFVISREPLAQLVPIENAAMAERTVIQWDKDDLDAVGLLKVDILALGMLSALRRSFDLIAHHHHRPLTLTTIPAEDPATYAMIRKAETIGVFQIESRAQMSMLPRLAPRTFYDLVIEVAIVRPGPIQGNMVHPYLQRRQGLEPVSYPSEEVRHILERTLGVPIFQEQAIKLAMVAAGFSAGEADQLRRAIGAWRRKGELRTFEQQLYRGMQQRGYSEQFAQQIFAQIQGFGEYGFPESHSASFALLAYTSAWLKRHYPAAFTCALLNSQPMGFYPPAQLVGELRRQGGEVRPVDIQASGWECTLERVVAETLALRLGLGMIKGLGEAAGRRIEQARRNGPFRDVADLARRADLDRPALDALANAGALANLSGHRRRAHWAVQGVEAPLPLFPELAIPEARPTLPAPAEGQEICADYSSLGLTLRRHPLALLRPQLSRSGLRPLSELRHRPNESRLATAGLVSVRQRPGSASGVIFVTLEDESGQGNVVVWPKVAERFRQALLGARLLVVRGRLQRQGEVIHLVAEQLEDQSQLLGELPVVSRDFH